MRLLDSNVLIYLADPRYPGLSEAILTEPVCVSAVTVVEVLGYHLLTSQEEADLRQLLEQFIILPMDGAVTNRAIKLRQNRKTGLGDALVAATALVHDLPLVTRNVGDFRHIAELRLLDPLAGKP